MGSNPPCDESLALGAAALSWPRRIWEIDVAFVDVAAAVAAVITEYLALAPDAAQDLDAIAFDVAVVSFEVAVRLHVYDRVLAKE